MVGVVGAHDEAPLPIDAAVVEPQHRVGGLGEVDEPLHRKRVRQPLAVVLPSIDVSVCVASSRE